MDKVAQYRAYIQDILTEYAQYRPSYGDIEVEVIMDPLHDHYQLVTVGWNGYERIHGSLLHLDIKQGKIWIQHDGTEEGIANRLVEQGVPKTDIVLAFHSPFRRQFTGFAVE
ncbi:XisI protein [Candidatus Chloroploca sp. Khr17]|uniref:XisI protein n=1 Tax=Candidatus Chloroploca sp. Khr17 TaxID=2496869 RepID=UPI00101B6A1C|nr:XisI protein [Candidatus Chloroploca sp. Khr17]